MRILILNQYYWPDVAATAQLAADLGEHLAKQGHHVTAVASTRAYNEGDGARLPLTERHAGVRILRVPATALGRGGFFSRAFDYGSFLAGALPLVMASAPDVVIALSTPPLVGAIGLLAKRILGARLVYWVMDLYPDLAVRLGALREDSPATRALERISRSLIDGADAVVALDDAMRTRLISAGAPPDKVVVIDNWVDGDAVHPMGGGENPLRAHLGLSKVFTIQYSGNMGLGHDFSTVLKAMALLRDDPVHWLFIGDGPRRPELEDGARAAGAHTTFLPYQPRAELPISLTAADVSLVTLERGLAGMLVPSKLYGVLAAGQPLLYVGPPEGRVATVIDEARVGIAVRNGDAVGLTRAVRQIAADPVERELMGQRARALHESRFARDFALQRYHSLLRNVAAC